MYHRDGGKGVALVGTEASEATWPSVSPVGAHRPQPPPHPSGTRRYHRRRGVGAIGSHGEHHGPAAHWEIWMAASALGPLEALRVTSAHGAHFLGVGRLVYEAETLDEVWPNETPFGPYDLIDEDGLRHDDRPVDYWNRLRE